MLILDPTSFRYSQISLFFIFHLILIFKLKFLKLTFYENLNEFISSANPQK